MSDPENTSPDPPADDPDPEQELEDLDVTKEAGASVKGGKPILPT